MFLFAYVYVFVYTHATVYMWRPEEALQDLVLSFHPWLPGMERKYSGLATNTFPLWTTTSMSLVFIYIKHYFT